MRAKDCKPTAESKFNCGLALTKLGDSRAKLEEAITYFDEALAEFKTHPIKRTGRYNCLFNLGTTHRRLGNFDKSA
jgi:tetratricopeptide (TPR) repeat protein